MLSSRQLLSIAAIAGCVALGAVSSMGLATAGKEPVSGSRWGSAYVPNVPLVTHDGRTLKLYDDIIRENIVVVSFIYTSCANICPLVTARLAEVKEALGDAVGRDIVFVSITLDPIVDGPEVLAEYAKSFGDGKGWLFLTGAAADIDLVRWKLGERSKTIADHRKDLLLGNGRTGEWQRQSAFSDITQIVAAIREMDPDYRDPMKLRPQLATTATPAGAGQTYDILNTPGQALFAKACAPCHTIGAGKRVGPDLAGIGQRRERSWLESFMIDPDGMRARGDAEALALDRAYPGVSMPDLSLSKSDVADLLSYIETTSAAAVVAGQQTRTAD